MASLAPAEAEIGALAKADQYLELVLVNSQQLTLVEAKVQPILGYRVVQIGFGVSQIHVFESDSASVTDRQTHRTIKLRSRQTHGLCGLKNTLGVEGRTNFGQGVKFVETSSVALLSYKLCSDKKLLKT